MDAHRDRGRRDGGRYRHTDAKTQVGIGTAEHDGQDGAQHDGYHREFGA